MNKFDRLAELELLREESRILEEKAGLTQKMEDAQTPSSNPEWTSKEYFEFVESHLCFETRSLYFSVKDTELRKKLIATKRKINASYQLSLEEDVMAAKQDISVATAKILHPRWLKAGAYCLVLSIISYWILGNKGLFLGVIFILWFLKNEHDESKYELAQASENLREAEKTKSEESNTPEVFSAAEEQSGTEDVFEDEPSDILRHYASGKLRST